MKQRLTLEITAEAEVTPAQTKNDDDSEAKDDNK